jgi:very-short-patch-repair endonuclease
MQGLGATKNRLRNLLLYTDELLSFNEKVTFDLAREPYPHFHEFQVAGLEGVETALDDETWLRIQRLRETRPPDYDPMFDGWVDFGPHPSADQPPQIVAERVLNLPIEDISDLAEAGFLPDAEDIMRPVGADEAFPERMDAILRIRNLPEFEALWQDYINGPWANWAETERPRRRAIEFYNKVYQIHQRMIALGDDTPIELVFGIGIARWVIGSQRINVPLIEQLAEIELQQDGSLYVRPRQMPPQLVLKAFHGLELEGSKSVQRDLSEQLERAVEDPDVGFSPFDKRTFEKILRGCTARLSSTGIYHPDMLADQQDRTLPDPDNCLRVTDTWVIYVRQRSSDFRREDLARLIKRVEEVAEPEELPAPGVRFVVEPSDKIVEPEYGGIDLSSRDLGLPENESMRRQAATDTAIEHGTGRPNGRGNEALFFPLAYNDEQEEVIRRLEAEDSPGVIVQGPPGTGKTHTIANIISHFLATRRRVLVTAKTPEALRALQEKIPEGIRDLAISVIHNDREGARQLQHAVQVLADEAKSIDARAVAEQIKDKHARLRTLRDHIAEIDREFQRLAERNLARLVYEGEESSPMELARWVISRREEYGWFSDHVTLEPRYEPQFTSAEIDEVRVLRRLLCNDLIYDTDTLPEPDTLPDLARVIAAHAELGRIGELESATKSGEIPHMQPDLPTARSLRNWVVGFADFMGEVRNEPWLVDLYHLLLGLKRADPAPLRALREALVVWTELHRQGREYELQAVVCDHAEDPALDKALEDLAAGRKPFGIFSMFKGGLKAKIENTAIEGRSPSDSDDWVVIRRFRAWQQEAHRFVGRWSGIAGTLGLPVLPTAWEQARSDFLRLGRLVERLHGFHSDVDVYRQAIRGLFPYGIDPDEVLHHGRCAKIIEALNAHLEKADLTEAIDLRSRLSGICDGKGLPFYAALRDVCANLGTADVPQRAVAEAWQQIVAEAQRLDALRSSFTRLNDVTARVAVSGAPNWANKLRHDAVVGDDPWTTTTWQAAWEWARADGFLKSLGDRETIRHLSDERASAEAEQRKLFAEVVRLRTFLGMKSSLSEKVEAALAKFTTAIARLGKGTGKSAGRYRRIIREAALDAARAVPCWILPEWRVAEQLPAELGSFDLVVIDEASQSDITALPAILRGEKVLIVGDDKQVSPTVIGIEDRKVLQLRTTFLSGIPFADQMDPATSLYELAGMVYPGRAIILREHFRCVEPIISFSSRFYPKPLIPLRIPTASERLDPPLVDMYVKYGKRVREINEAEVDVIVAEITKIVADPKFDRRSLGVISLIGNAQANRIYTRLITELGAEVIEKHRIMCGNAATFQGQERDIVFLSMVACPETAVTQTARIYEQRFNVAASRARDRLVLVRSLASSDLRPGDLKLALIEHFRSPMKGNLIRPKEVLELCQSDFERDFGRYLLDLEYRIRPQVPVGGYAIDFVVEGADDRRLAIELDGDKYHGPDRWADDIRRQRALERLGWIFWRCWGSAWISDRERCLTDLMETLARLDIEPIGMGEIDGTFTEHIEVPPPTGAEPATGEGDPASTSPEQPIFQLHTATPRGSQPQAAPGAAQPMLPLDFIASVSGEPRPASNAPVHEDASSATGTELGSHPKPPEQAETSGPIFEDLDNIAAEVGDLVFIRYDDQPDRRLSIRLSSTENSPSNGIVHVSEPLGTAIIGASVDEQVTVKIGNRTRTAVVEQIEKARPVPPLAAE